MKSNTHNTIKWYLHVDLDAFFASVEQLDNPEYKNKPVIVGGSRNDKRGVVSTASYEARKFGVHSAMPIFQAVQLCPNGIYLKARIERYSQLSYKVMNILKEFSPDIEQMSIDEAFVDLTGTEDLFGPPEETAFKVKRRIKEATGLTVSVGLATTKYLAKIASDYSKPDGFYFIKPGQEQSFMLSLPLKKVWGLGPKTLEKLKKAGIYTTKDILNKSYDILTFSFGSTLASFLYNVVRGNEIISKKRINHSISSERTFSCDIHDIYTAETKLLELTHEVLFRLLKEEKYSRTITLKIKYDNFSLVSIQRTFDKDITTIDSFFEKIKLLFEEKYQPDKGIRLLGVGFDKVKNKNNPEQQYLFSTEPDKQDTVEKTIIDIQRKHPCIKIQKARLLKSLAFIFIIANQLISTPLKKHNIFADTHESAPNDFSISLTQQKDDFTLNNNTDNKGNVTFDIFGHWQFDLSGNVSSYFGKDTPFYVSSTIPVFKQDIELSSNFTLNNKWYFEGSFADNFSNNTLTMGYNSTNYFPSGKISNRNITMPNSYSVEDFGFSLAGGNNQAPGIAVNWESPYNKDNLKKWRGDLLLRYDMTLPRHAVFHGMNKITDNIIEPKEYLHSYSFNFPNETEIHFQNIKNIYIESDRGETKDKYGKTYKKLSKSDYYYSASENILYLSNAEINKDQQNGSIPTILVTFKNVESTDYIIKATGNYNDSLSYAGKIQAIFNKAHKKYDLTDFTYPLKNYIENDNALVIQNTTGFSPYVMANVYDCGTNPEIEISVTSKGTNKTLDDYIAEIERKSYTDSEEDFFNTNHIYAKIINKKTNNQQFPFAEISPEIYLNIQSESDVNISLRLYNPVSNINIGQKVSAGSIQVFKNGRYIKDFIYDINTGNINFFEPVKTTDNIKITWQEEASDFSKGAFAMGIGFQYNILPELKWDIALTAKKPVIFQDSFSTPENIQNSFVALSTGINFTKSNSIISESASFAIEKPNDSERLLISSQNDFVPKYYELDYDSGYETKCDTVIENKRLSKDNNYSIKNHNGEKDNNKSGYKIPLQWDFTDANFEDTRNTPWASVDIKLKNGKDLKKSSQLKLNMRVESALSNNVIPPDYRVYLQLGIKASSDYSDYIDNNDNIPVFDITNKIDFQEQSWQTVVIYLSDKDRAYLTSNNDIRIIVIPDNKIKEDNKKGKIAIGTYSPVIQSIFTASDDNIFVSTTSTPSGEKSYSSKINWTVIGDEVSINPIITAITNFTPSDFNPYKKINFKFAYEYIKTKENKADTGNNLLPELTFILDTDNITPYEDGNTAIKLELNNISEYVENIKNYHQVSISLIENNVYIDNIKLSENDYNLYINKDIIPSRIKYKINTRIGTNSVINGNFYVDNVFYEECDYTYSFQNNIRLKLKKDKILNIKDYPLLQNGFIDINSYQQVGNLNDFVILSSLDTGITIGGIQLQTDISFKKAKLQNAGYNIKTSHPIFKIISLEELLRINKENNNFQKVNILGFSLSDFNIPFSILTSISAKDNNTNKIQNQKTNINFNFKIKNNNTVDLTSSIETNQNLNTIKNKDARENTNDKNIFENWYDISKFQFSMGDSKASARNVALENKLTVGINNNFIMPIIGYTLSSLYENIENKTFKDDAMFQFILPINFYKNSITLGITKKGSNISDTVKTKSYMEDFNKLFSLQKEKEWFYTTIPFYELFDKKLPKKINGTYSIKYEINYGKELFNSFKDLYIPSSITFAVIRDIKSGSNSFSDLYQIKSTITNISINNFGKNSKNQIFSSFYQEEIMSNITGAIKIPVNSPENITYQVNSFLQILLWINNSSKSNNKLDMMIDSNSSWYITGTSIYERAGKTSLISAAALLFSKKAQNTTFNIIRKDSFYFSVSSNDSILKQQYSYNHNVDTQFLEYFTISMGIGCTFTHIQKKASSLALTYSIGGKLEF